MIAPQSVEQLLNAAVIEDVVGEYVALKRSGSRFKGVCPFHDEKTPSFVVTPTLGIYKCFGCQKGGNSINFLMEMENLSYAEAIRNLAKKYGIELIETGVKEDEAYKENQKLRENIQIVLDYAQKFFSENLTETEEGQTIGLEYFKERGYSQEIVKKWGLGYSPTAWEALATKAKNEGYTLETLELAGLLRKRENQGYYDLFRNRVIFPIHGVSGRVIAFAGRKMSSSDPAPKYVNSPETELYKKSEILYGIFQAKNAIKKEDKVYLTEGYTDVISLSQFGVENVVASSGTALTPGQIRLIRRFTHNITVVYDGDSAGIKASMRGIDLLLTEDLNVRVVALPDGEDPDSWCRKLGSDGFAKYLAENEKNFIFFKANLLLDAAGNDPIKRTEAIRDILESVANIGDPLKRNSLNQELSKICGTDETLLAVELSKIVKKKLTGKGEELLTELKQITQAAGIDLPREPLNDLNQERAFVKLLLLHGHEPFNDEQQVFDFAMSELSADENVFFTDPICVKVVNMFFEMQQTGFQGSQYFVNHTDPEISAWAAGILSQGHLLSEAFAENYIYITHESDNFKHELMSIFVHLRRKKLDSLIQKKMELLKNSDVDIEEVLLHIVFLESIKTRISSEFGYADYKP